MIGAGSRLHADDPAHPLSVDGGRGTGGEIVNIETAIVDLGRLLGVSEVARWLRVSPAWVRSHAGGHRRPILPSVKMGGALRFRRESVERFIADCERAPGSAAW